jgi:16S rRNA (uracil1498-N3)-methyltransferase
VFNRRDGEWIAVIADEAPDMEPKREIGRSDKKRTRRGSDVSLIAKAQIREGGGEQRNDEGESKLRLCFAPLKRARLKILFEKATEMGVTHLQPVLTEYTDVAPRHAEEMMTKMERGLVEAAEQCERIGVPEVLPAMTFDALLEEERDGGGRLYICRERGGARPIMEVLERDSKEINEDRKNGKKEEHRGTPSIVIGPEGGFSPRELAAMKGHPRLVSLGPSVLRAETAGLVAVGVYVTWQEARSLRQERQKISPAE